MSPLENPDKGCSQFVYCRRNKFTYLWILMYKVSRSNRTAKDFPFKKSTWYLFLFFGESSTDVIPNPQLWTFIFLQSKGMVMIIFKCFGHQETISRGNLYEFQGIYIVLHCDYYRLWATKTPAYPRPPDISTSYFYWPLTCQNSNQRGQL